MTTKFDLMELFDSVVSNLSNNCLRSINAISLARVLAVSLVGKSQVWNIVKHRRNWKILSFNPALTVYSLDLAPRASKVGDSFISNFKECECVKLPCAIRVSVGPSTI